MSSAIDKAVYSQLLAKSQPKVIETETEYEQNRCLLLQLMLKEDRTPEESVLLTLISMLVRDFDQRQETPDLASPHEVLLHLMEENAVRQADLVGKVGSRGVVSEIVNGKRSISKSQAKALAEFFHVSPAVFM